MLLDRDERWMISSTRSYSPSPEPKLCKTEDPQPHYIPAGAEEEDSTWDDFSDSGDRTQLDEYLTGG